MINVFTRCLGLTFFAAHLLACQKQVDQTPAPQPLDSSVPQSLEVDGSDTAAESEQADSELAIKADELLQFAIDHGHSTQTALLIDFSRHSGQNRLFVWDLQERRVLHEGLVAHGHCRRVENPELVAFSNTEGSNCSSEGIYRIGKKYEGQFGTSYKLHGLEESNSAAFQRYVVMHGHSCVPDTPQKSSICLSEGCPTLSPAMMQTTVKVIDSSEKPMLMWVFK